MRGRHHDAVCLGPPGVFPVVANDCPGQRRGRGVFVVPFGQYLDSSRGQHLDGSLPGGQRQSVGVLGDEQRTGDTLRRPVLNDRLGDGHDMSLVER